MCTTKARFNRYLSRYPNSSKKRLVGKQLGEAVRGGTIPKRDYLAYACFFYKRYYFGI